MTRLPATLTDEVLWATYDRAESDAAGLRAVAALAIEAERASRTNSRHPHLPTDEAMGRACEEALEAARNSGDRFDEDTVALRAAAECAVAHYEERLLRAGGVDVEALARAAVAGTDGSYTATCDAITSALAPIVAERDRLSTSYGELLDQRDDLEEILGCDDEHGLIDQARDLIADRDLLAARVAELESKERGDG